MTFIQSHHVTSTLMRRCINLMCPLGLVLYMQYTLSLSYAKSSHKMPLDLCRCREELSCLCRNAAGWLNSSPLDTFRGEVTLSKSFCLPPEKRSTQKGKKIDQVYQFTLTVQGTLCVRAADWCKRAGVFILYKAACTVMIKMKLLLIINDKDETLTYYSNLKKNNFCVISLLFQRNKCLYLCLLEPTEMRSSEI